MEDKDKTLGQETGKPAYTGPILDLSTGNVKSSDGSPFTGPVDKSGVTSSLGLYGKTRYDYVMTQAQVRTPRGIDGPDYDTWVLSLPEDANDIAYTQLLRAAKQAALARQRVRAQVSAGEKAPPSLTGPAPVPAKITGKPATPEEIKAADEYGTQQAALPPPIKPPLPGSGKRPPNKQMSAAQTAKQQKADDAAYKLAMSGKAQVFGLPVDPSTAGVGGGPGGPTTKPDPYVQQWLDGVGLYLTDDNTDVVVGSGQWVYTGNQQDPNGPAGFTRPSYTFIDDAESIITGLPAEQIKAYQHKLGLSETGVVDPELQGLWHEAVKQAQVYARQGVKVTLQFIFDSFVTSAIAKKSAGAGGAGGKFADETPTDLAGADYYQAMMQVLGDISGVGSGQA